MIYIYIYHDMANICKILHKCIMHVHTAKTAPSSNMILAQHLQHMSRSLDGYGDGSKLPKLAAKMTCRITIDDNVCLWLWLWLWL